MADAPEPFEIILHSRGDTRRLGHALARCVSAGELLLLEGELGAGKTFLARAIARGLGVPSDVRITSPTFDLVHELPARIPLVHVDLYRLDAAGDLLELGLPDRIGRDAIVLIEWGARFARDLGGSGLLITLDRGSCRRCLLAPHGPAGPALLARLRAELEAHGIHGRRCSAARPDAQQQRAKRARRGAPKGGEL